MSQNNSIIKSLITNSYNGSYEATVDGYVVVGNFNADGNKILSNVTGTVKVGDVIVATFNAYKNGDNFRYNFSDITDITLLSEIATAVETVIDTLITELAAN